MQLLVRLLPQLTLAPALCALLAGCAGLATTPPPAAVLGDRWVESSALESGTACGERLAQAPDAHADERKGFGNRLVLASWNAQKSTRKNWEQDLHALSTAADILLLQEATISPDAVEILPHSFVAVAEGYRSSVGPTGVLSASHVDPLASCTFTDREPLLRTRKASSITRYPLPLRDDSLLVGNVHAINYSLGLGAFEQQLTRLAIALKDHQGPIIFAGDFNTWHRGRARLLNQLVANLGLHEVQFAPGTRRTVFGHPLSRIYARGLPLVSANTMVLNSSDHNAIIAVWNLDAAGDD